jgi:SAM-dependent methyltransferase
MAHKSELKHNINTWQQLYSEGKNDLRYPNDIFIRCYHKYFDKSVKKVLDYGFGTGANLIHLADAGCDVSGVEISKHAIEKTKTRLNELGLLADLRCIEAGGQLPWPAEYFDAVVTWQVLCYNDWSTWEHAISELERVLRPGGLLVCATAAPGDISQTMSESIGNGLYKSKVPGQEGCLLAIPEKEDLNRCFPGRNLDIGEFSYTIGGVVARHWVVIYKKNGI